jgi:hypothetical protein
MNLGQQGHLGEHVGIGYVAQNSAQPSLDLFGRINTCTPTAIFTSHPAFTTQRETMDFISTGSGVITHDISNTLINLQVGTGTGKAVRQSREYLLYQPGKLQSCYITSVPQYAGTWDNSVVFRTGLFDDYRDKSSETNQPSMGQYFELSGNSWFVCERLNSTNNILNVNRIPQANWNLDTLNGVRATSPSGFTLRSPPDRGALFIIDRQWLGVGIVRMGVIFNGKPIFVHVFHDRLLNRPYTHLPKLPVRWELEKVSGGASATATAASVCASVQVMGQYTPLGALFTLPTNLVATSLTSISTTLTPILFLRLQQKHCRATFKLKDISLYSSGDGHYTIFKNPTIALNGSAAITYTSHPDSRSMVEYSVLSGAIGNYTISGGTPIRSGFFQKTTTSTDNLSIDELITASSFCSDIAGTPDVLVVGVASFSGNISANADIRWLELV